MSNDNAQARAQLLLLKGVISELPDDEQAQIKLVAQQLKDMIATDRKVNGMAVMLAAVEYAASGDANASL